MPAKINPVALTVSSFVVSFFCAVSLSGLSQGWWTFFAVAAISLFVYPTIGVALASANVALWKWADGKDLPRRDSESLSNLTACGWPLVMPLSVIIGVVYGTIRRLVS